VPEITELRPGLWAIEANLPDFRVRGALVVGSDRAILFDSLSHPDDIAGVGELVPGIPLSLIYSHGDWDHVWGSSGLFQPVDEVIAHQLCTDRFAREIPETLATMQAQHPGRYESLELIPPTRSFRKELALDLGGITLELHALPGHTLDSIVGFIPEWGILLAGDSVETPLPFLNPGSPLEGWTRDLDGWATRLEKREKGVLVIPSHGRIGGPELLRENANYLKDICSGRPPDIPEVLDAFYRETHQNNLALARDR